MSELRKYQRKQMKDYLMVSDLESGELIGRVLNITTEGIMILSENSIPTKKIFKCSMRLPDVIEGKREIEFELLSCWSQENQRLEMYQAGFKFLDQSQLLQNILRTLVRDWSIDRGFNIQLKHIKKGCQTAAFFSYINSVLLKQYHLFQISEIICLQFIQIDTRRHI